jgi:hypothetical protein
LCPESSEFQKLCDRQDQLVVLQSPGITPEVRADVPIYAGVLDNGGVVRTKSLGDLAEWLVNANRIRTYWNNQATQLRFVDAYICKPAKLPESEWKR